MDINLTPAQTKQAATLATSKTDALILKLNQQLEVKVISIKTDLLTLSLQTTQSHKPIQVQSNLPVETIPGEKLQLLVTKIAPTAEFKVLNTNVENPSLPGQLKQQDTVKPLNLKNIVLKQIISGNEVQKMPEGTKALSSLASPTVTAKIISITGDKIQLKLYTSPNTESSAYTKTLQQNVLQKNNPIITLSKDQLTFSEAKPTEAKTTGPKLNAIDLQNYKPGQKIQLEVKQQGTNPKFNIIEKPEIKFSSGQILNTKITYIKNNTLQLQVAETSSHKSIELTLNVKQLSYPAKDSSPDSSSTPLTKSAALTKAVPLIKSIPLTHSDNLKLGQQLKLEVTKPGLQSEFKILDIKVEKPNTGQIITAKVITITNNKIQLQLTEANSPTVALKSNNQSPTQPLVNTTNKNAVQPPVITINKNQISYPVTDAKKPIDSPILIKGQQIKIEVIKTGGQTEFKLIQAPPDPQQKIIDTVKQLLPIQESPTVLLNQIIKHLEIINKNEKIPDTLKRLAKEIFDSLPQGKSLDNPKQLKQSIAHTGLFMEAKLLQYAKNNELNLPADFKHLLLKFHKSLKQELETKQEQNVKSTDLNLIKELQQKTENTLARIILNQLASLPKDDGPRQVWILDLPFLHKENAASVKIEIDREQHENKETNQENWTVAITISPPEIGTIHCKISCFDKTINTRFWSDKPETVTKIASHLDYLKTQLEQAGIITGHMSAHKGLPSTDSQQKITNHGLFDQQV